MAGNTGGGEMWYCFALFTYVSGFADTTGAWRCNASVRLEVRLGSRKGDLTDESVWSRTAERGSSRTGSGARMVLPS